MYLLRCRSTKTAENFIEASAQSRGRPVPPLLPLPDRALISTAVVSSEEKPPRPFPRGSAMSAVLSTAFEAARCDHLPRIALPLAIEDGPSRRAAGGSISEDQAVVGLIRPGH